MTAEGRWPSPGLLTRAYADGNQGERRTVSAADTHIATHELTTAVLGLPRIGASRELKQAIEYIRQGCEALEYVHSQQIVHRDVKPHNLILGRDGIILVDFGIARLFEDQTEDEGTIGIGTPRYMAPEVFAGGSVCLHRSQRRSTRHTRKD
jgi:serine/threonine protein kinase